MTTSEYARKLAAQDGVCAICKRKGQRKRRFAIDHCDATKWLRGLLCTPCNIGLGLFGHAPQCLRAAADYVEIWRIIHQRRGKFRPAPFVNRRKLPAESLLHCSVAVPSRKGDARPAAQMAARKRPPIGRKKGSAKSKNAPLSTPAPRSSSLRRRDPRSGKAQRACPARTRIKSIN